jgi:MoaA/NifB/PqqE/SkfB family radical SAM enzyme
MDYKKGVDMNSYTAANEFPHKIVRDLTLLKSIYNEKKILPRHVQLSPTNRCTLNCSFCSCQDREKNFEWSFVQTVEIIRILTDLKTIGVTITGGGEPLLFRHIDTLIWGLYEKDIKMGLVSNGTVLLDENLMNKITWCRFSFSGDRKLTSSYLDIVGGWIGKGVDLAFSYVVLEDLGNMNDLVDLINFANDNNFTHIRLVSDILNSKKASENILIIKNFFKEKEIDDKLVIYQTRNAYTKGTSRCLISLLKPMIYSNGRIYGCCGSQYAIIDDTKHMPNRMIMGYYNDLPKIIEEQKYFDGSICDICYYQQYNQCLSSLLEDIKHLEFI